MAQSPEQGAVRAILTWLTREEERHARSYNSHQRALRERLTATYTRLNANEFANLVHPRQGNKLTMGSKFIYGRSNDEKHWIPVLNLSWDFDASPPAMAIRVAQFQLLDSGELHSTSVRFETPHGDPDLPGDHRYCHMQFINSFEKNGEGLPGSNPVSQQQLAVPVDAQSAVSLLIAVAISLYDRKSLQGLGQAAQRVRPFYEQLFCLSPGAARKP